MYCLGVLKLLPLQGALPIAIIPRALPWAKSFCPLQGVLLLELLSHQPVLKPLAKLEYLSPLEKVIFDNFFKCNHLIIKWHFVGKRTKNYFLK